MPLAATVNVVLAPVATDGLDGCVVNTGTVSAVTIKWVRERARAMVDWWDWAPLARRIHDRAVARLRAEA